MSKGKPGRPRKVDIQKGVEPTVPTVEQAWREKKEVVENSKAVIPQIPANAEGTVKMEIMPPPMESLAEICNKLIANLRALSKGSNGDGTSLMMQLEALQEHRPNSNFLKLAVRYLAGGDPQHAADAVLCEQREWLGA